MAFQELTAKLLAAYYDSSRLDVYPFGAIEGLVLDTANPNWRDKYFSDKFALEKFYGNRTTSR